MALNSGRHLFGELEDGTQVTYVEKKVEKERADFLKELLEHNGYHVIIEEEKRKTEEEPQYYTVCVDDITFNPVIAVYNRHLHTHDGRKVTPDYWNQITEKTVPTYWEKDSK
ncbi:MAG: hypothetical protein KDC85_01255 [Saprospiraceae bacterium]|nr:hypothetical protein [Saprospiraceae bacterium]MCB9326823.1 hypothetical protein [Lewinellaceae bacterium]